MSRCNDDVHFLVLGGAWFDVRMVDSLLVLRLFHAIQFFFECWCRCDLFGYSDGLFCWSWGCVVQYSVSLCWC